MIVKNEIALKKLIIDTAAEKYGVRLTRMACNYIDAAGDTHPNAPFQAFKQLWRDRQKSRSHALAFKMMFVYARRIGKLRPREKTMTPEEHRQWHIELHRAVDELYADYLRHHLPRGTSGTSAEVEEVFDLKVKDLMAWSFKQTQSPDELPHDA